MSLPESYTMYYPPLGNMSRYASQCWLQIRAHILPDPIMDIVVFPNKLTTHLHHTPCGEYKEMYSGGNLHIER